MPVNSVKGFGCFARTFLEANFNFLAGGVLPKNPKTIHNYSQPD